MSGPFFSESRLQPALSTALSSSQYYTEQTPRAICALCLPQEQPHRPNSALQTLSIHFCLSRNMKTQTFPFLMTAWFSFPFPKIARTKVSGFVSDFLYLIQRFIFGMTTAWSNSINFLGNEGVLHSKCDCWPAPSNTSQPQNKAEFLMHECIILLYEYTFDTFYKFAGDAVRKDKTTLPWSCFSLPAAIKGFSSVIHTGQGASLRCLFLSPLPVHNWEFDFLSTMKIPNSSGGGSSRRSCQNICVWREGNLIVTLMLRGTEHSYLAHRLIIIIIIINLQAKNKNSWAESKSGWGYTRCVVHSCQRINAIKDNEH